MNLAVIDWILVAAVILFSIGLAYSTNRYSKSVEGFLVANRIAGRYVLTMAEGMVFTAAVGQLGAWQSIYNGGLAFYWWGTLVQPSLLIMMMTGWVIYRYRESRVMTLAELFEKRYSKNFRISAAIVAFTSGVLNFAIFPALMANFVLYFFGFPEMFTVGGIEISTYVLLVVSLVILATYFTFIGGQISVIVTDFFQGFLMNVFLIVIIVFILSKFQLSNIFEGIKISPEDSSMLDPFRTGDAKGFNASYYIIGVIAMVVNRLAWQSNQGYNAAAKTPHEAKMAGVLQGFRVWITSNFTLLLPLTAYMLMHHPDFTEYANIISQKIAQISNKEVADQMITPISLTTYLPKGLMGIFAVIMLIAFTSTADTYMHSWGSMFVQDILLPLTGKKISTKKHIKYLRLAIIAVGIFSILWSIFIPQIMPIWMFFAITGAIWLGCGGVILIGALYTRWGTTYGAYAALAVGSVFATGSYIVKQLISSEILNLGPDFQWIVDGKYFTGQWVYMWSILFSATAYFITSLITKKEAFNLEKLLNRGKYRVESDHEKGKGFASRKWNWKIALGITDEFTLMDKVIYLITTSKVLFLLLLFAVCTTLATFLDFTENTWASIHKFTMWFWITTSFGIATWLIIGGIKDVTKLFMELKSSHDKAMEKEKYEIPGEY